MCQNVTLCGNGLTLSLVFRCLQYKSLENSGGKGEIVHKEQFLLFPPCFQLFQKTFCHFHQIWNCRLQTAWVWKSLKFVVWERFITLLFMYLIEHVCIYTLLKQKFWGVCWNQPVNCPLPTIQGLFPLELWTFSWNCLQVSAISCRKLLQFCCRSFVFWKGRCVCIEAVQDAVFNHILS